MKINRLLKIIRSVHSDCVIIIIDYNKFRIYNEDAYISSYLFKYRICKLKYYDFIINKVEYLNYVKYNLRKLKINYIILDKHDGYNVIDKYIDSINNYLVYLKRSKIYDKRINIINKIKRIKDINKIMRIEKVIYS